MMGLRLNKANQNHNDYNTSYPLEWLLSKIILKENNEQIQISSLKQVRRVR